MTRLSTRALRQCCSPLQALPPASHSCWRWPPAARAVELGLRFDPLDARILDWAEAALHDVVRRIRVEESAIESARYSARSASLAELSHTVLSGLRAIA